MWASLGGVSGIWGIREGNPVPVANKWGNRHLLSIPRPFLVVVVWGVWETGRAPSKMTRAVLTYLVLGKEYGN